MFFYRSPRTRQKRRQYNKYGDPISVLFFDRSSSAALLRPLLAPVLVKKYFWKKSKYSVGRRKEKVEVMRTHKYCLQT